MARASKLNLYQQVEPFLKWLQGWTKDPANSINALTSVNILDTTLQTCQYPPKAPFLPCMSAWNLQLARASTLHLDQQVQPVLKWLQGQTQDPTNRINTLTRADLVDATTQAYQELPKAPFLYPTSDWHLQLARYSTMYLD